MKDTERVEIWNTFFKLARGSASELKKYKTPCWVDPDPNWEPKVGGTLGEEDRLKLSVLSWCILAAQARASHLIQECRDKGYIDKDQAASFGELNFKQQWLILSMIGMIKTTPTDNIEQYPFEVIKKLHKLRDGLFHVNLVRLKKELDKIKPDDAWRYFSEFVKAVDAMNVLIRGTKSDPNVLRIAKPFE